METRNSIRPLGPVVIDIENITKDYVMGEEVVRALRGVTLQIRRNEYIAVMGPSGSGKSTLTAIASLKAWSSKSPIPERQPAQVHRRK